MADLNAKFSIVGQAARLPFIEATGPVALQKINRKYMISFIKLPKIKIWIGIGLFGLFATNVWMASQYHRPDLEKSLTLQE